MHVQDALLMRDREEAIESAWQKCEWNKKSSNAVWLKSNTVTESRTPTILLTRCLHSSEALYQAHQMVNSKGENGKRSRIWVSSSQCLVQARFCDV